MLGAYQLLQPNAVRASGTTPVLLAGAAIVAILGITGTAQAQDCVGGYRMIKGEIPIACDSGLPTASAQPVPLHEPLTTGSIARAPVSAPPVSFAQQPTMTYAGKECVGGYYYRPGVENSYNSLPMRCQ